MENELKQIAEDTWLTQVRHYLPSIKFVNLRLIVFYLDSFK